MLAEILIYMKLSLATKSKDSNLGLTPELLCPETKRLSVEQAPWHGGEGTDLETEGLHAPETQTSCLHYF